MGYLSRGSGGYEVLGFRFQEVARRGRGVLRRREASDLAVEMYAQLCARGAVFLPQRLITTHARARAHTHTHITLLHTPTPMQANIARVEQFFATKEAQYYESYTNRCVCVCVCVCFVCVGVCCVCASVHMINVYNLCV